MFYLSESKKRYYRYFGLLAVVVLGIVSILGTGGGGDSAPPPPPAPSVIATSPAQGADTALVTTEVTAQFSETMDPLTINANSFLLHDSGANPIVGSITFYTQYGGHDNVAVFVPSNDLDVNQEYFATITTEVRDTSGDPLARDYNWSFFIAPSLVPVSTDSAGSFGNTGINTSSPSAPNAT
ncbi:MAG: Ig-like domain-containing protein, partial [Thiohalomonadales bacterium]|nr:Ig-like domain-containing protein [Thiohalomonadales bacterium]